MTTSDQLDQIAAALAAAQGDMAGAVKDSANPFFKSQYADLASVWDACRGPLSAHGLAVVQVPETAFRGEPEPYEWTSKTGETRYGVRMVCVVSVTTRLLHSSGQWIEDTLATMLPTGDPQAVGSAITYLRRYALQAVAGVAPADDDAEAAQGRGFGHGRDVRPARVPPLVPPPLVPPPLVPPRPAGYDDWLDDLAAVADEGTARLQRAWAESKPAYRSYLTTEYPTRWDALKARAAAVPVTA